MKSPNLEKTAQKIFGTKNPSVVERWINYWSRSKQRCDGLLRAFEEVILLDFRSKKLLDIGCGTGALGETLRHRCGHYVGVDIKHHILQFSVSENGRSYVQGNGLNLPFAGSSYDCIFAFDVLEHLPGGLSEQIQFLKEIRRILKPLGIVLFTTPNHWYPYDAHSDSYFAHYLPNFIADWYHQWSHPAFLKEHGSTSSIRMLSPRQLRQILASSGLILLHDLPCCLDRSQIFRVSPLKALMTYLGLGWYPHAEFWGVLCHPEAHSSLRLKLKSRLSQLGNNTSMELADDFSDGINFRWNHFSKQLGKGWHECEKGHPNFRWIAKEAVCYLQTETPKHSIHIQGYSPWRNRMQIWVDGVRVGEHLTHPGSDFNLNFLLPFSPSGTKFVRIHLKCDRTFRSEDRKDLRDLGLTIFFIGLKS